jgi:hypothetical protein
MALPILDGNQSATTLSSILTSGEHIPAHTVVSLGTQAITDISGAVSGSVVSISNFPATQTIAGTVTANLSSGTTANPIYNYILEGDNDIVIGNTNPLPISGTVTANLDANSPIIASQVETGIASYAADLANDPLPISGTVTISSLPPLAAGTANIGVVTIGNIRRAGDNAISQLSTEAGSNYLLTVVMPGTSQIGSVTASISNSVTIGSLPAISGTVTANLSISSTVITSGSFSSLSSATLVPENPARKMATVFNLGAGQLFINAGVTATTLGGGFMVALSSGDFYECDYTTTTLSAIFATAGTASWMSH